VVSRGREEHKLRVLKKTFGSKREELRADWRKFYKKNFVVYIPNLFSGDQVKVNEMGGTFDTNVVGRGEGE
jgi:hypothetical protein